MRREALFGMTRAESIALLRALPYVEVATTRADGAPILRALDTAWVDDALVFHGSPVGEKVEAMGREAVAAAVDRVAFLPSYFVDPERACPATTLYRSVMVRGALSPIEDGDEKARALTALLASRQPEGGHVPLSSTHPLYRKALASLLVFKLVPERVDGKSKLGQNRSPAERVRILEGLFRRGERGDLRAIELVREACPDTPTPPFLAAPLGASIRLEPGEEEARECAELLASTYWNDRFEVAEIAAAHVASTAWVCAKLGGRVVASARALSDGSKRAWIYDVVTAPDLRGRGLGAAVMRVLLDHPRVRAARLVELGTRDAEGFYERFGFRPSSALPQRPYATVHMVKERPGSRTPP